MHIKQRYLDYFHCSFHSPHYFPATATFYSFSSSISCIPSISFGVRAQALFMIRFFGREVRNPDMQRSSVLFILVAVTPQQGVDMHALSLLMIDIEQRSHHTLTHHHLLCLLLFFLLYLRRILSSSSYFFSRTFQSRRRVFVHVKQVLGASHRPSTIDGPRQII